MRTRRSAGDCSCRSSGWRRSWPSILLVGAGRGCARRGAGRRRSQRSRARPRCCTRARAHWTPARREATRCCWATSSAPRPTPSSASCCARIPSLQLGPGSQLAITEQLLAPTAVSRFQLLLGTLRAIVTERYSELQAALRGRDADGDRRRARHQLHRSSTTRRRRRRWSWASRRVTRVTCEARVRRVRARSTWARHGHAGPTRQPAAAAGGRCPRAACAHSASATQLGARGGSPGDAANRAGRAASAARRRACPLARGAGPSISPCSRRRGRSRRPRRRPSAQGPVLRSVDRRRVRRSRRGDMRSAPRSRSSSRALRLLAPVPLEVLDRKLLDFRLSRARAAGGGPARGDRRDRRGEPRRGRPLALAAQPAGRRWSTASHDAGVTAIGLDVVLDQPATSVDRRRARGGAGRRIRTARRRSCAQPWTASSTTTRSSQPPSGAPDAWCWPTSSSSAGAPTPAAGDDDARFPR